MRLHFFLMLILLLPVASAITTNMQPTYQPGETMIIEINGNILQPIFSSNVVFKRAHVAIAIDYDLKRIGPKYYLYAQLPLVQNNYTLFLNDVATTSNGVNVITDFNQSFSVSGEVASYSINPGFAIINDSLSLSFTLNYDQPETINLNFPDEQSFTLQPGQNSLNLQLSSVSPGLYQAVFGRYTIPIQVLNNSQPGQQTGQNISLQLTPPAIRGVLLENASASFSLSIKNLGESAIENLLIRFNTNLFNITPYIISSIGPNSSQQFNVGLIRISGPPINSEIIIQAGSSNYSIPVNISFTLNSNETTIINESTQQFYCSELGGIFCTAAEICSTDPTQALDGSCCVGTCTIEESSGFGWIGYTSIGVIILILLFIYLKYKKSGIPKPKDIPFPTSSRLPSGIKLPQPTELNSKSDKK